MARKRSAGIKRSRINNWDDQKDEILLGVLKEQKLLRKVVGGHVPYELWPTIVEAFNCKTDLSLGHENLKNRVKVLKRTFGMYHAIVNNSGWEWDPERDIPKPDSPSKWNEIIAANPIYAKCKGKPFPRYRDLDFLCGGIIVREPYKGSMGGADDLGVMRKSKNNLNSTSTFANAEAPLNQYEADTTQPNHTSQDSEAFSEEHPSSFSSEQHFTYAIPISCRKSQGHVSDVPVKVADINHQQAEIALEKSNQVIASRPNLYSIEDCMKKLEKVEGIIPEIFVAACESFKDQDNRTIFMNLDGPYLMAWIDHQMRIDHQLMTQVQMLQQLASNSCGPFPGFIPSSNTPQSPISGKSAPSLPGFSPHQIPISVTASYPTQSPPTT